MAYYNTGHARRKLLTVTKGDYNQTYNICSGFTDASGAEDVVYPALSDEAFARLTEVEYQARLTAFCNYVYSQEDGLQADCPDLTQGSTVYDPVSCPLPVQSAN